MRNRPPAIAFIFITLFLDILGIGLVIPVLPKLVEQFRGGDVSEASTLVGQLSAVYALMQFVFSPILGAPVMLRPTSHFLRSTTWFRRRAAY
jgi:DHA1 family tetracycline resistance protein-like MFS transporter